MPMQIEISMDEIEYLKRCDEGLRLQFHRPAGDGPFPLLVDVHGGAWTRGDMTDCAARAAVLAEAGVAVAALNFRDGAHGYPASLVDINYAIRWLKARADDFAIDPGRVGLCGQSSGGHLAMLSAMRPDDPRYLAQPLPSDLAATDATVRCVAMTWPVINPLSRYRHALRRRAEAEPPAWVGDIPERHDLYWKTEATMEEGNPMLALERGEAVRTPPAIWIQGRPDEVHDYHDPESGFAGNEPERFVANYRKAGGDIELAYVPQESRSERPTQELVRDFVLRHLGG